MQGLVVKQCQKRKEQRRKTKENFCDLIFNIDEKIRFVGIVNKDSEVIDGGFKKGIEPLLDEKDEQDMYLQSLSNYVFFSIVF